MSAGLVGYGSSDEDSASEAPVIPSRPSSTAQPLRKSAASTAKVAAAAMKMAPASKGPKPKKQKIVVSILPPQIQAALARGPAAVDSDDELDDDPAEEERRKKLRQQAAVSKEADSRRAQGATGLMALLPKPKAEKALDEAVAGIEGKASQAPPVKPPAGGSANEPPAKVKPPEAAASSDEEDEEEGQEEEESVEQQRLQVRGDGAGVGRFINGGVKGDGGAETAPKVASDDDDEDEDEVGLHPFLMAAAKAESMPRPSYVPTAFSLNRSVLQEPSSTPAVPSTNLSSMHTYQHSTVPYASPAAPSDPAYSQYYQQQQQPRAEAGHDYSAYIAQQAAQAGVDPAAYAAYLEQMQQQQQQGNGYPQQDVEDDEEEEGGGKSRRRNKSLQRQLAQGKLDVLEKLSGQVADVQQPTEKWDPYRFGPPKKTEKVRIQSSFYDTKTGETVTRLDATKTHKRKHHINTLALQAAEREMELLDGKAQGMLTKAQTQGKYGW